MSEGLQKYWTLELVQPRQYSALEMAELGWKPIYLAADVEARDKKLEDALTTITNMSQEDFGEAIKSGDMVRMLGSAVCLFNQCRDVAQQALARLEDTP